MTYREKQLPDDLFELSRDAGFDPHAVVVPSASGMPLQIEVSPADFREYASDLFEEAESFAIKELSLGVDEPEPAT